MNLVQMLLAGTDRGGRPVEGGDQFLTMVVSFRPPLPSLPSSSLLPPSHPSQPLPNETSPLHLAPLPTIRHSASPSLQPPIYLYLPASQQCSTPSGPRVAATGRGSCGPGADH